jgi:hypothetical protein
MFLILSVSVSARHFSSYQLKKVTLLCISNLVARLLMPRHVSARGHRPLVCESQNELRVNTLI